MNNIVIRVGIIMSDERAMRWVILASLTLFFLAAAVNATAGTTGTEFTTIYDKLKDWSTGYLGKTFALASFLVGLGYGAFKGSLIPAIGGIGIALMSAYGVPVIEGIATATLR